MGKYSALPEVDAAFALWVEERDPPAALYPDALGAALLGPAIAALDADVKVVPTVHATVEHSALVLAVKASKLAAAEDLLYAQLNVHLSRAGRLGLLEWEWRTRSDREPVRGATAPGGGARAAALEAGARALLEREGVRIVPRAEARREVRVEGDPHYEGAYYEITVFEALFGMGYPERQR